MPGSPNTGGDGPPASVRSNFVVIGNFDGVHLGHRAVLQGAVEEARSRGLCPVVLTFEPHPSAVLGRAPAPQLTTLPRKVELIRRTDPSLRVHAEPFTLELARSEPREFARALLVDRLHAASVLVGANFRFGHQRAGDLRTLQELGGQLRFDAHCRELVGDEHGVFSSSRVRAALAEGDLAGAQAVLGRPHALSGVVVHGDHRGRTIGFPTANLAEVQEALPPHGVYACLVDALQPDGSARVLARAVANIGVRPTFGAGPSIEAHLLDFDGDLYGARLRVHLVARLRPEQRFAGLPELVAQIRADVSAARELLGPCAPDPAASGAWY